MIGLAAFVPLGWLGLSGGGFDVVLRGQVGIVIWWVLILGLALSLLPLGAVGRRGWIAMALLGALAVWTGASLLWTDAAGATWEEFGRLATYLGVLALGLFLRRDEVASRQVIAGVSAALVLLVLAGLASRLLPDWSPADIAERFDEAIRLSYPLDYWNGLAALAVIALPLLLAAAAGARERVTEAFAAALIPAVLLTGYLTFSRSAVLFAAIAVVVYLALAEDRLRTVATLAVGGLGGLALVLASSARNAFEAGLAGEAARGQGLEMLAIVTGVAVLVGLIHAFLLPHVEAISLPSPPRPTIARRTGWLAAAAATVVLVGGGLALGGGDLVSSAWTQFKDPSLGVSAEDAAGGRFTEIGGNGRYQYWGVALEQFATAPLNGAGAGSYGVWWLAERPFNTFIRNAHSLPIETLGELGLVGFGLIAALMLVLLIGGLARTRRSVGPYRAAFAAAFTACLTFVLWSGIDWLWQVPVLPAAFLLLAAALVGGREEGDRASAPSVSGRLRIALGIAGLVAIAAAAIPMVAADQLRGSRAAAEAGDLDRALLEAQRAIAVQPGVAAPRREKARVLALRGELGGAVLAARQAVEREPADWQNWLVLSRLERTNDDRIAAERAFERARATNPLSPVFE